MRTEVNIITENAEESVALFAVLAMLSPYSKHRRAAQSFVGETGPKATPTVEPAGDAMAEDYTSAVVAKDAPLVDATSATAEPQGSMALATALSLFTNNPSGAVADSALTSTPPEPIKRPRKTRQTATTELAPTTGPSPSNPGPSVDLDAALDAAGATTLEGDVLSPGDEQAPQEDAAGEPEDVMLEAAAEAEEPASDLDDLMGDMLDAPTKVEPKTEPKQEAKAEPAVDDNGDPRTEAQLHQAVRDEVINRGGGWLRDMLGSMHINRISDLTKTQALSLLASPVTA